MSLTRAQWEEMWKAVKAIERVAPPKAQPHVATIKGLIEQVVGQME